jgi:hypothetical protein
LKIRGQQNLINKNQTTALLGFVFPSRSLRLCGENGLALKANSKTYTYRDRQDMQDLTIKQVRYLTTLTISVNSCPVFSHRPFATLSRDAKGKRKKAIRFLVETKNQTTALLGFVFPSRSLRLCGENGLALKANSKTYTYRDRQDMQDLTIKQVRYLTTLTISVNSCPVFSHRPFATLSRDAKGKREENHMIFGFKQKTRQLPFSVSFFLRVFAVRQRVQVLGVNPVHPANPCK